MVDLSKPNEWQHICPDTGLVMPWYTKPALDEIVTWDMKDKVVFEYGCGASSLWWAAKARKLYGVDSSSEWIIAIKNYFVKKQQQAIISCADEKEIYVGCIGMFGQEYDVIVIDGTPETWRDDCVLPAIALLKPGGALIIDNWDQPSVWMPNQLTKDIILLLQHKIYRQENHPDWQTLIAWRPL